MKSQSNLEFKISLNSTLVNNPLVSVIIPSFNELPEIIYASLSSIRSQSFEDFECIVIDDSTDPNTQKVARDFCNSDERFIYVKPEKRLGLAASLNLGIKLSKGKFIARFDADDICLNDRLSKQINFFRKNLDVDVLGGALRIINQTNDLLGYKKYPIEHADIEKKFIYSCAIAHPTIMFKKSSIDWSGYYDPKFKYCEDLDLWLRLLNKGCIFANLPDVIVMYRQSTTSRPKGNWHFNVLTRIKNLSKRYLVYKLITISLILAWSVLPRFIQNKIYKFIMFEKRDKHHEK